MPAIRREGFDALLILQAFPVSASARFAPARLVRRKYKGAAALLHEGEWLVYANRDPNLSEVPIGKGRTRGAAWRSAAFRVKTARD